VQAVREKEAINVHIQKKKKKLTELEGDNHHIHWPKTLGPIHDTRYISRKVKVVPVL
jgi:hypothetical protein